MMSPTMSGDTGLSAFAQRGKIALKPPIPIKPKLLRNTTNKNTGGSFNHNGAPKPNIDSGTIDIKSSTKKPAKHELAEPPKERGIMELKTSTDQMKWSRFKDTQAEAFTGAKNSITANEGEHEAKQNEDEEPTYPCICEYIEENGRSQASNDDQIPSLAALRLFWMKKSMEGIDLLMRYKVGRDSGNSSVASSSSCASSGSSCCAPSQHLESLQLASHLPPNRTGKHGRPFRPPVSPSPMQEPSKGASLDSNPITSPAASSDDDPAFPTNSLPRRPLTGATRVDTLERNRIEAIDEEHKYETLDHGARPGYYSEDEGVCCTNIHSQLAKKAKELVRPYQKGDHPKDRPPIPAKPPRPSLSRSNRLPSNEGISDKESNYNENLDLLQEVKAAAQTAGYEPIDTSRGIVPPIPGVPTSGPLMKKDKDRKVVSRFEDSMEAERREFWPVLATQTSIDLKGGKPRTQAPNDAEAMPIEVKVASSKISYENVKAVKGGLVVAPTMPNEKRGLMQRVKSIKMENPFKKGDGDEDGGADSSEKKPGLMGKMFKREKEAGGEESEDKKSFSDTFSKVFHREKKADADIDPNVFQEEKITLSDKLGKMFNKEAKESKDPSSEGGEKKSSFISKVFSKESKELKVPTGSVDSEKKPTLINKMFSKEAKEEKELCGKEEGAEKKPLFPKMFTKESKEARSGLEGEDEHKQSLISWVFSRAAKDGEQSNEGEEDQEKKTFSEMMGDFTGKVFTKTSKEEGDHAKNHGQQQGEKKTFIDKYFPTEKPIIQQVVLTEEMEPDLKKRRMGRITSFQYTKETEGDTESPAKKMLIENLDRITTKVKKVQEMMPKAIASKTESGPKSENGSPEMDDNKESKNTKHDYEITTQIVFTKDLPSGIHKQTKTESESGNLPNREDLHITSVIMPVLAESTGDNKSATDKTTFFAKIGDSEIEVKEDHYGRIQVGERKEPIYARPFKMLKRSLQDLSKSTPSLSAREESIQYMDASEVAEEVKEEPVNHHYDELGEPGKKQLLVKEFKVRGIRGSPKVIKIETQLVKGKSTSALNEPATITTIKTVEKQKPPVPPRPRPTTPTIIGKPSSPPTTPISLAMEATPLARAECSSIDGTSVPSTRATTPSSLICEGGSGKKIPPARPPPPRIATVTTKVTPTAITTTTVSSDTRPQTTTFKKPPKPQRPPPPKVSVTKTVTKMPIVSGSDKYSVYCQTDVNLSTDLLARIERVVSSGGGVYEGAPYKLARSRSGSFENVHSASPSCLPTFANKPTSSLFLTTFYDEPVCLRKGASLNESDLSKRISSLQIAEQEELPPLIPPKLGSSCCSGLGTLQRSRMSETDADSGDSVYYDCTRPDEYRSVTFAAEEDVRYYDRVTDESRSNSLSQNTPSFSVATNEANPNDSLPEKSDCLITKQSTLKSSHQRDPSLDSDSDWSDGPIPRPKPSPSILLKKRPLSTRTQRDPDSSSTDTDNHEPVPHSHPRKRIVKRSPIHSTNEPRIPEGFKRYQVSDSDEDTDDLLKRATEVQDQLRKLLSYRTKQLRVCLEAEMSSSTDADHDVIGRRTLPLQEEPVAEDQVDVEGVLDEGSSDSEEDKELTPPPSDPKEKARKHAANVAWEMANSEAIFVDALKLIVEDFKGAIDNAREERGDILVPNEVLDPILLYLPELLTFSSDLLDKLDARVKRYNIDHVIADVFVKIGQFLKLYSHYIKDYQTRCNYLEDARKRYPEFNQVMQQFEASPRCQKLTVVQHMLKPVQRIPQYRLLLRDYLRNLDEEHPDRANTETALQIVSQVADHANEAIKQGDKHAEMVRLQNSLITPRFNVFTPGRMLIKQGILEKHNRKTSQQKQVVLFTDCLVYMTQVQSTLNTFRLNRELPLAGLTVKRDEAFPKEFQVLSASKSFILIAQTSEEREEWIEAIQAAVNDYKRKRLTLVTPHEHNNQAILEGESIVQQAPVWTPDCRVTMCQNCQAGFTTFRRRHHCRACGRVVCGSCSKREAWLNFNGGSFERVCDSCVIKFPRERLKSSAGLPEVTPDTPTPDPSKCNNIIFFSRCLTFLWPPAVQTCRFGANNRSGVPVIVVTPPAKHECYEICGANDDGCTMSGYLKLFRKGGWKRYWYVLKKRVLFVYKASADVAPINRLPVLGYEVVDADDAKKADQQDLCFKLRHQGLEDVVLCAEDPETAAKWKQRIRDATQLEPTSPHESSAS
ncbi:uncharacterized protein LOC111266039 isoform X3 [Varroa jacobsoni]|uniref:uncharacterized protein LOC111266039 isoform X3 n=1 Tax=Varroa jacobsoni TaxID=62625 RepID=UPI000BF4C696|nr:uncharacterized protein LOC111266039 isoform X3 [Varroa jacobsoni]